MKAGDEWRLLRYALMLECLSLLVYVTIPDYPWGTPFWQVACLDPNGWLHECFYIIVGFAVFIEWTFRVEERQKRLTRRYRRIKP